jgi:hypothetical protein
MQRFFVLITIEEPVQDGMKMLERLAAVGEEPASRRQTRAQRTRGRRPRHRHRSLVGAEALAVVAWLAAHSAQFTLLEQVRVLKEQMTKMKEWSAEKQKFELKAIDSKCFAYMLKPEARGTEPPHWLCTACYEQGRKSILQYHGRTPEGRYALFRCTACKGTITTAWSSKPTFS